MRATRTLVLTLLGVLIAVAGTSLLFSTFMAYDDEGYVLLSLQSFTEIGGLYEKVYSQYGPFFFLFNQLLHFLGFEFTNTGAREFALVCWLGASLACGFLVWRLTLSLAATVFSTAGVFIHLWPMINEPSHPGGVLTLILACSAALGVRWLETPRKLALLIGLAGSALLLTKINVGVFFFAGAAAWWALHLRDERIGLPARAWLVGFTLAAMPFALMRGQLGHDWVLTFAIVASAAGTSTVLAAAHVTPPLTRWRDLALTVVVVVAVSISVAAAIMAQGTSPTGLLEGVMLGPLRHPQAYSALVKWRMGAAPLALAGVGLAVWCIVGDPPWRRGFVFAARWIGVAVFLGTLLTWSLNPHAFVISYGLGLIWVFVMPPERGQPSSPAITWLALLLVPQALQAFPVAGSQISWGTFLWIPLAVVAAHATLRQSKVAPGATRRRWLAAGAIAIVVITLARCANFAWMGVVRMRDSDSLDLPGAKLLRLPHTVSTAVRVLARNAAAHADVLFSLPGMHSFHLWTDVPPPTTANATHWFTLLSPQQQEAIRAKLAASPRSCVIVQRYVYDHLKQSGVATESPLTVWLHANYDNAFSVETYEFWVRKGRRIAPLDTVTVREAADATTPRFQLTLTLAEPQLRGVAAVELNYYYDTGLQRVTTWTNENARFFVTPINSAGQPAGPRREVSAPFDSNGLVRLEVRTDRFPGGFPVGHGGLLLRDADGRQLAAARFVH